ncbi:MAG: hypothetical protein KIC76_06145 [Firmicutes bacterium]|jgi:hypothetical protein|nr:hypothetical protein [Bacillota bacterium]
MICKNCKNPLPSDGIVCKFCGTLMSQEQINDQRKYKDREKERIVLLSEKYGHENKIEYRENKENKILGFISIVIVLLVLIFLAILMNM